MIDELHSFANSDVYIAARTALIKRPGSKLWTISTAGQGADSPLGQLRQRGFIEATGPDLKLLEWGLPDGDAVTAENAKKVNPASWISEKGLERQREAVADLAFRRFHLNQWVERMGSWLPPGAWQACAGDAAIEPGESIWVGLDVGGTRSDTAIVWLTADLRVQAKLFSGDAGVLRAGQLIRELAGEFTIQEVVYDPWRAEQLAQELEQEGLRTVQFSQSNPQWFRLVVGFTAPWSRSG